MNIRMITFKGEAFVLVGDDETEGAIATKEQYANGERSFAHLYRNGDILSFGEKIGTVDDIVFGDISDIEISPQAIENVLLRNRFSDDPSFTEFPLTDKRG